MGKTKSKPIRKATKILKTGGVEFSENFTRNKKILEGLIIGKKLRNQMAGLMVRTKKQSKGKIIQE